MNYLNLKEPNAVVLGIDRVKPEIDFSGYTNSSISFQEVDLLDRAAVDTLLKSFQPEYILHLDSVSSVAQSWKTPLDSFVNNTNIF